VPDHELYFMHLSGEGIPGGTHWLSRREAAVCDSFRFPKRRNDWLLGRWTAKQALLRLETKEPANLSDWEIIADESGAPVVSKNGEPWPVTISLSHSNARCLCALSHAPYRLGCDLELVEPRSASFEETYFATAEIEMMDTIPETRRAVAVTLAWSAKESVLKALRTGLSADTLRARILQLDGPAVDCWQPFKAIDAIEERPFAGWWMEQKGMVMTVVTDARTRAPIRLES
jgi:4'-phosphopantetheinyl transferase